jgi:hypothetical protein
MDTRKQLTPAAYTVGLIYVKPDEMHAIIVMRDEEHKPITLKVRASALAGKVRESILDIYGMIAMFH